MLVRKLLVVVGVAIISAVPGAYAQDNLKAVTTFTVIADIARNVAGDAALVESITKPGAEIHNYQPTPGDILRAQDADLILWNGLNLELWFERFLANLSDVPSVVVSDGVEPIGIGEGPYAGKPNPHAWMSPRNALIYIDNIRDAFIEHDPGNADDYRRNAAAYRQRIEAASRRYGPNCNHSRRAALACSSEGAFSYLARDFGLKELYLWPINADQQGTPAAGAQGDRRSARQQHPGGVFGKHDLAQAAQQVARETGAKYGGVLYVDSLSEADGPVPTYLDLLRVTAETIAKGLAE
jgi:manganese/iron transport system substrate-binding protein